MEVTVKNVSEAGKTYYYLFDKKDLNLASVRRIMAEDGLEIPDKFYFLTKNGNALSRYQEEMFTVDQIYKDREILLKAGKIENESLLDDPKEPTMKIYIIVFGAGRTLTLDKIRGSDSILKLKTYIQHLEDVKPDIQNLIYNTIALKDNKTCSECGIRDGAIMHLVTSLKGS